MKYVIAAVFFAAMSGIPAGCQNGAVKNEDESRHMDGGILMSEKERQVVAKMKWIETANPQTDALRALNSVKGNKPELIAFAGRGISFPGLSKEEYLAIESRTQFRIAKGSGDIIYGDSHKKMRRKLRDYVSEYNRIIFEHLTSLK